MPEAQMQTDWEVNEAYASRRSLEQAPSKTLDLLLYLPFCILLLQGGSPQMI